MYVLTDISMESFLRTIKTGKKSRHQTYYHIPFRPRQFIVKLFISTLLSFLLNLTMIIHDHNC